MGPKREGEDIEALFFNWSDIKVSHLAFLEYLNAIEPQAIVRYSDTDEIERSEPTSSVTLTESLEKKISDIVARCFWSTTPPLGHNRPTREQITEWILDNYKHHGLTAKAASRIYKLSKPDNIPSGGNLPAKNKPFPTPKAPLLP